MFASLPAYAVDYTVTSSVGPGGGGTITKSGVQTVDSGAVLTFTLGPSSGYSVSAVTDTCNVTGTLSGKTYTTGPITSNCTVVANFVTSTDKLTVTVTKPSSSQGALSLSGAQTVNYNGTLSFTLTPASTYYISEVSVTGGIGCGGAGTLVGNTFTTGPITSNNCTVTPTFATGSTWTITETQGSHGTMTPAGATQTVPNMGYLTFTLTPSATYHIASMSPGGCRGTLVGSTFTAGPILAACSVQPVFAQNTFFITTSAGPGGGISVTGGQTVTSGSTPSITVTPNAGLYISKISGCGTSYAPTAAAAQTYGTNPKTLSTTAITADCTVSATFGYTVSPSAATGATISPATLQLVAPGSTTSFTLGTTGSTFSIGAPTVSTCGVGGSLVGKVYTTGPVTSNCTVAANIETSGGPWTVTATPGSNGKIGTSSTASTASVFTNGITSFTVTPNSGYYISSVYGCSGTAYTGTNVSTSAITYTTGAVTGSCPVTATFAPVTFPITLIAGTGGAIGNGDTVPGTFGTTTPLTVTVNAGYTKSSVTGCSGVISGTHSPYTYTIPATIKAACTVTAAFTPTTVAVTPKVSGSGTISPAAVQTISYGGSASFTLTPNAGYDISSVVPSSAPACGVGGLSGNTYTTTGVTSACTLTAYFVTSTTQFAVTPSAGAGGTISPSAVQYVGYGGTAYFKATPINGYAASFASSTCPGSQSGNTYTTNPVTANCKVIATFAATGGYTVTVTVGAGGLFGLEGPTTFAWANLPPGYVFQNPITVTPDAGNLISAVTGTCGGTLNSGLFTTNPITANCTINVSFLHLTDYAGHLSSGQPIGIASGPDGSLWFTQDDGQFSGIGTITPGLSEPEYIPVTPHSLPTGISAGPDGTMWFTEYAGNKIGRMTSTSYALLAEYPIPTAGSGPSGITTGPDGNIWFTEVSGNANNGAIGRITNATGTKPLAITEFSTGLTANSAPTGITTGPDGNIWFTENGIDSIGQITPAGHITEYPTPTVNSSPSGITVGPDGNLWFTENNYGYVGNIGRITASTFVITEFPAPGGSFSSPMGIAAGPDGNLWFTEYNAQINVPPGLGKIGRLQFPPAFDSISGAITYASNAGMTQGPVYVGVFSGANQHPSSFSSALYSTIADAVGGYTISGISAGTYTVEAVQTQNINAPSFTDPFGYVGSVILNGTLNDATMTAGILGVENNVSRDGGSTYNATLTIWQGGMGSGVVTANVGSLTFDSSTNTWTGIYPEENTVKLTAAKTFNSTFSGWLGCDTVSSTVCTVTMSGARNVTVIFNP